MKAFGRARRPTRGDAAASTYGRVAWYSLQAYVALVPLVTSVVRRADGGGTALTEDPYHVPKLVAIVALSSVATLAWIADLLLAKRAIRADRSLGFFIAFSFFVLLSTACGFEPLSSLFGATGLMTGTITWLTCGWAGFLIAQYVTGPARLREVSWAVIGGGCSVALVALLQAAGLDLLQTPSSPESQFMVTQGLATLGNPNYTGLMLVVPSVVGVGLSLALEHRPFRVAAIGATALMVTAAFITLTRAAWLGVAFGTACALMLIASDRTRLWKLLGGVAAVGAAALTLGLLLAGTENVTTRFITASSGLDAFSSGRVTIWREALGIIANRPLLGTGADRLALGAYEVQIRVVTDGIDRFVLQDPHNLPLLIAGLFGIPALVALAVGIALILVEGYRLARRSDALQTESRLLYASWVAAAMGFLVASLLSVYTITGVMMLFVVLMVVAAPQLKPLAERQRTIAVVAVLSLSLLAIAWFGAVQSFRGSRQTMLASSGESELRLLEAIRLTPWDTRNRLTYQWRKIGAYRNVLTGADVVNARAAAESLDSEIRAQIVRAPYELLWYRMLIDLYDMQRGLPGYQPGKVIEAIDLALAAFPNDPEFTEWRARTTNESE